MWAQTLLDIRREQGLDAEEWGVLQPNIDANYYPIEKTTMPSSKVTLLIRKLLEKHKVELKMTKADIAAFSSHSCKATLFCILAKRGVGEDTR